MEKGSTLPSTMRKRAASFKKSEGKGGRIKE